MRRESVCDELLREFVGDPGRHDRCVDGVEVPAGRQDIWRSNRIVPFSGIDVFAAQCAQEGGSLFRKAFFNCSTKLSGVSIPKRRHRIRQQIDFTFRPALAECMESKRQKCCLQFFDIVAERVNELIIRCIENGLAEIGSEVVLPDLRTDLSRNHASALHHFLRLVLIEHLLNLEDRSVHLGRLERRNQMIDHNRKAAALGLQAFADSVHCVKVHGRNRFDHNVGEIKACKRDLFSRKPLVARMPPDVNDDIRFEDISKVFVKRQILMMRRNDVRTVKTVRIGLPSTLRLWAQENVS